MLFRCVSFLVCDMVPPELTKAVYLYVMEARCPTLLRVEQWLGPPALSIRLSGRNSRLRCSPLSIFDGSRCACVTDCFVLTRQGM